MSNCRRQTKLEEFAQFVPAQVAIAQYLGEQPRADLFFAVNWYDRHSAVGMPQDMVTTFNSNDLKSLTAKGNHQLPTGNRRQSRHAAMETR